MVARQEPEDIPEEAGTSLESKLLSLEGLWFRMSGLRVRGLGL